MIIIYKYINIWTLIKYSTFIPITFFIVTTFHAFGQPDERKKYMVPLPQPRLSGDVSVERALYERRSVRSYSNDPLTIEDVSQLLWAAQGITTANGFRTVPSAGALYPLEVYVVVGEVKYLRAGIYHYIPDKHTLELHQPGDKRLELSSAALGQSCVKNGAVSIVFSAIFDRITKKYGERGIRYTYIEVGHASQNIYLQVISLNLGTVSVGAFRDEQVKRVIGMQDGEEPLYIMPVGSR